jgi:hypothetical protein
MTEVIRYNQRYFHLFVEQFNIRALRRVRFNHSINRFIPRLYTLYPNKYPCLHNAIRQELTNVFIIYQDFIFNLNFLIATNYF